MIPKHYISKNVAYQVYFEYSSIVIFLFRMLKEFLDMNVTFSGIHYLDQTYYGCHDGSGSNSGDGGTDNTGNHKSVMLKI